MNKMSNSFFDPLTFFFVSNVEISTHVEVIGLKFSRSNLFVSSLLSTLGKPAETAWCWVLFFNEGNRIDDFCFIVFTCKGENENGLHLVEKRWKHLCRKRCWEQQDRGPSQRHDKITCTTELQSPLKTKKKP
jgi:hypothetical protein